MERQATLEAHQLISKPSGPTKPKLVPSCKMKPLHWKRIILNDPSAKTDTVWVGIEDYAVDMKEIEGLFGQKPPANANTGNQNQTMAEKVATAVAPEEVEKARKVLEPRQNQAIEVAMKRLPPTAGIKAALIDYDTNTLTIEKVENLLRLWPRH